MPHLRPLAAATLLFLLPLTSCQKIPVVNQLKMPNVSLWPKSWWPNSQPAATKPAGPRPLPSPDQSTLYGSLQLLHRKLQTGEAAQIAPFLHCDNDPDGQYVSATAERIAASMIFHATLREKFASNTPADFDAASQFGVVSPTDFSALLLAVWKTDADRAAAPPDNAGHPLVPMRNVSGTWKLDVTPPAGPSPARIALLERHTAAINQTSLQLQRDRLRSVTQAFQSLRSANLPPLQTTPRARSTPDLIVTADGQ